MIMRGGLKPNGSYEPNYHPEYIEDAQYLLDQVGLGDEIIVDVSHGNSAKKQKNQPRAWYSVVDQRAEGNMGIVGGMIEGYLKPGNQKFTGNPMALESHVSITDECIPWTVCKDLLLYANKKLSDKRNVQSSECLKVVNLD